jgi:hypothetical protein
MNHKKRWAVSPFGKPKAKLSDWKKNEIENRCQPLIERFKKQYVKENPDKTHIYSTDVYTKWRGNSLYFCQKFKSGNPEMIKPEFEESFVRIEYWQTDSFNFSYFRHTGKWFPVASNLSLSDCLQMIEDTPNFHPTG